MRIILLIAAAFLLGGAADDVLETWPDGSVKVRCGMRNGELQGSYSSFHENGKRHVTATYKAGERNGKYTERRPDGTTRVIAKYKAGRLVGDRKFYEGKKVVSEQKWEDGRLVRLDGIVPHPRTAEEIREALARIEESGSRPDDALAADRQAGLRTLKTYRYLAGVPWEKLALNDDMNARAQAGAALCEKLGRISHNPPNPGVPDEEYRYGLTGTTNCSLGMIGSSAASVHGYMHDSDPSNIDRLGHRSWCLDPAMGRTGFGLSGDFCAMWTGDGSGGGAKGLELLLWPPKGYVPTSHFPVGSAFSVWALPGKLGGTKLSAVKAHIWRLDGEYLRKGEPLTLNFHKASRGGFGPGAAFIFRPAKLDRSPGARYFVELEGVGKKGGPPYRYVVEFLTSE